MQSAPACRTIYYRMPNKAHGRTIVCRDAGWRLFLSQYFQKTARCRARQDTKTNENLIESNTMPDKHENANRIYIC